MSALLSAEELTTIDAWWRTANYLSVGQIYLLANPLLRHPLTAEHVKPRLLGHWGTTPGLNFVYVHMNRAIAARGISTIYVTGPGHGGPGLVAGAYLDGTYTEIYRHVGHDEEGLRRLFRQLATRSGSVDPGLLLWLLERCDLSERELADGLEHRSGLLGLGGSADMRDLLARADDAGADDARARGAIEVYLHRLRSGIGAMAAALGGVDALAFTGGVGENSPPIRAGALDGLGFLGLSVDPERNHDARLDARISPDGAGAAVVAVRAREDLEIARQVRELFA